MPTNKVKLAMQKEVKKFAGKIRTSLNRKEEWEKVDLFLKIHPEIDKQEFRKMITTASRGKENNESDFS